MVSKSSISAISKVASNDHYFLSTLSALLLSGLPVCSSLGLYYRYVAEYDRVVSLEKNELLAATGCLRPCQYMEYSVREAVKNEKKNEMNGVSFTFFLETIRNDPIRQWTERKFPFILFLSTLMASLNCK